MTHSFIKKIDKLVGIDLETTGSSFSDRIIEIALVRYENGILREKYVQRVNPGMPIPKASTLIHGIRDEDVADKFPFSEIVDEVIQKITKTVLFGYNILFDFNVLSQEIARTGRSPLDPRQWTLLDPFVIWKKHDPKTLQNAYLHFCGKELKDAHNALADISATYEVLEAQLEKFDYLPQSADELGGYCYPGDPSWVCSSYHFIWDEDGQIVCNFGKNKGIGLQKLAKEQRSFCEWVQKREFPADVKELVKKAMSGIPLPQKP